MDQDFPLFAKSQVPKVFRSGIYQSHSDLLLECEGLDSTTPVIISEIVNIQAEARVFVLESEIQTFAVYEGVDSPGLMAFAIQFVKQHELPSTCVNSRSAFLEANPTWGAGLNNCDPLFAARCIAQATRLST